MRNTIQKMQTQSLEENVYERIKKNYEETLAILQELKQRQLEDDNGKKSN